MASRRRDAPSGESRHTRARVLARALAMPRDERDVSARAPAGAQDNWTALRARMEAGRSEGAKKRARAREEKRRRERALDVGASSWTREVVKDASSDARGVDGRKPAPTGRNGAVTRTLALDCEMVGVGEDGRRSALARVSVVNEDGNVILDTFVIPTERVTDYRTAVSGVRAKDLRAESGARTFKTVQAQMSELLRGKILVGHSLKNDMRALMLDHPKRDTRDTSLYHPLTRPLRPEERCVPGAPRGRGCRALRDLARQHVGLDIQNGEHSSVDDARAALALYKKFAKKWEASLRLADRGKAAASGKKRKERD